MIRLLIAALFVLYLLPVSPLRGADALPSGLAEIAAAKRFVIGWRPEGRPMSWLPPGNAEPDGFSVALCRRIADAVAERICNATGTKIEVHFSPVTEAKNERFRALEDRRIDILCGTTTRTLSRAEEFDIDFTLPVFLTGGVFASPNRKAARVRGLQDLRGGVLGVLDDTTTSAVLEPRVDAQGDVTLVYLRSLSGGLRCLLDAPCPVRLRDGSRADVSLDAVAGDQLTLLRQRDAADLTAEEVWVSRDFFSFEPYALAISSERRDLRLLADRVLSQVYRGEEVKTLLSIYIERLGGNLPQALLNYYTIIAIPE